MVTVYTHVLAKRFPDITVYLFLVLIVKEALKGTMPNGLHSYFFVLLVYL